MIYRNTRVLSLSLPPATFEEIDRFAKVERKTKTELLKQAWDFYRTWKIKKDVADLRKLGEGTRKKFGFKTEDELYEYIHGD